MNTQQQSDGVVDLFIIGGGVNGSGIAADAAGRGLSVMLCEQHDFASGTSSNSTKLIHGGLRYLEHFEFRLVREALQEREVLLQRAPHIIWPLTFIMPHAKHLRPKWMIRTGLFLYDHLAKRRFLPGSQQISLADSAYGTPLKNEYQQGFSYADCRVDDARLVVLNALLAQRKGARLYTRRKVISAKRVGSQWEIVTQDQISQTTYHHRARGLVNAAGPWLHEASLGIQDTPAAAVALVQGSHFIVPKLFAGQHAYILQNPDRRIIFAIPYEHDYTLIGTTDTPLNGRVEDARLSEAEIAYLCDSIGRYFRTPIDVNQIRWTYSGVRPLLAGDEHDPKSISRDYSLKVNAPGDSAPLLTVFGGKLTTYRELAEQAMTKLAPFYSHMGAAWTASSALPGGDFAVAEKAEFIQSCRAHYPWLPEAMLQRYVRSYGSLLHEVIHDAKSLDDLGQHFGADLFAAEVQYLIDNEWACTVEDIIWRRSKLGLQLEPTAIEKLTQHLS